jgi:hypothetical protein
MVTCINAARAEQSTHSERNRSGMGGLRNLCRRKRLDPPSMGVLSTGVGASPHPGLKTLIHI